MKKQEPESREEEENRPGPNYISHRIPAASKTYASEVYDLLKKPNSREEYEDKSKENLEEENDRENNENENKKKNQKNSYEFDVNHSSLYNLPESDPKNTVEGKSSYPSSYNPYIAQYYQKYTNTPAAASIPYQKYSFQPVKLSSSSSNISPQSRNYDLLPNFKSTPNYQSSSSNQRSSFTNQPLKTNDQTLSAYQHSLSNYKPSNYESSISYEPSSSNHKISSSHYDSFNNKHSSSNYAPSSSNYKPHKYQPSSFNYESSSSNYEPSSSNYQSSPSFYQSSNKQKSPLYTSLSSSKHYQPRSSEQKLDKKKCRKVNKQVSEKDIRTGRFKRQNMDCFVCEDPKNGANYEQCSYSSEPNEKSYFIGKAEKYSKPSGHRYKRYAPRHQESEGQNKEEEEENYDPYEKIKAQSHKYYSKPDEFSSSYYNPKDFGAVEEYRFGPEFFETGKDGEEEKSSSEIQSEKLLKEGENCKKIKKEGMTCVVCKNDKNGGNYEQCSYTSAPAEKKYAYVRERKFDDKDNPIEDKIVESTAPEQTYSPRNERIKNGRGNSRGVNYSRPKNAKSEDIDEYRSKLEERRPQEFQRRSEELKKRPQERLEEYQEKSQKFQKRPQNFYRRNSREESKDEDEEQKPQRSNSYKARDASYEVPRHFEESNERRENAGLRGLDPELYGSADSSEIQKKKTHPEKRNYGRDRTPFEKEIEEYHTSRYSKEDEESESKRDEKILIPYGGESKKDVEEVLAEFTKKDRSNCKKTERDGMTCYLCKDKNGIKNEECMYISESQPKATHIAYHEVKQVKTPNEDEEEVGSASTYEELKGDSEASESKEDELKEDEPKGKKDAEIQPKKQLKEQTKSSQSKIHSKSDKSNEDLKEHSQTPKFGDKTKPKESVEAESKKEEAKIIKEDLQKRKRFFKKANTHTSESDPTNTKNIKLTTTQATVTVTKPTRQFRRSKNINFREPSTEESKTNKRVVTLKGKKVESPVEFLVSGSDGAFVAETRPAYSKVHGVVLPKYMVEKSEFEKSFDEFSKRN